MRASVIPAALVAAFVPLPAALSAQPLVPVEADAPAEPSTLAPLAAGSPWIARFEAAADELLPALQSRDESRLAPLFGGKWLAPADRERIAALLSERNGPFFPVLSATGAAQRIILGWQPPATLTADERAAIATRPEAEALVCWSSHRDAAALWPRTAAEADNRPGRPFACARIAYSIRGDRPTWRAFIEQGPAPAA